MASFVSSEGLEVPRLLGRVSGPRPGALLIAVGGIHGNEPAGVLAIQQVLGLLESRIPPVHGTFLGLAGNLAALAAGRRFLDRDLNRIWDDPPAGADAEAREREALERILRTELERHDGPALVIDCHTSSGPCPPFSLPWPGPGLALKVARTLGAPLITGFERHLEGLLLGWVTRHGYPAMAVELGAPVDEAAAVLAEALLRALGALGITGPAGPSRETLPGVPEGVPGELEVAHRHRIPPGASFTMLPGFATFDRVTAGQPLAHQNGELVRSPLDGWILLPKYQPEGEDGFFVATVPDRPPSHDRDGTIPGSRRRTPPGRAHPFRNTPRHRQ